METTLKRKFSDNFSESTPMRFKRVSISTPERSGIDGAAEFTAVSKNIEAVENSSDILIETGQETFQANKLILIKSSKIFAEMLKDKKHLKMNDVKATTVKNVLQYIYTNQLDVIQTEQLMDLYAASQKFGLASLQKITRNSLLKDIHEEKIGDIGLLGMLYGDEKITKAVISAIKEKGRKIIGSETFKRCYLKNPILFLQLLQTVTIEVLESELREKKFVACS